MDRATGARKQPQATASPIAPTPNSTRVTRSTQPQVEPQMEASNGVPLVEKVSKKRAAAVEIPPRKAKAATLTVTRATSPMPNRDDELLKLLKAEFETLRSLVTCTICYGLLYEPYTTHCGHTFCYNCLCKSFTEDQNRFKSCPTCRSAIKHAPAEAYLVRDMTHSFTKHAQLLGGPEETVELHEQARKEQKAAILKDKNSKAPRTGGLFKGIFSVTSRAPRQPSRPFYDPEDGVARCPDCMWELEDGMCAHCNNFYGPSDAYFSGYSETGDGSELAYNQDVADFADMDIEMDIDDFQEGDNPEDWFDQDDQFTDRTFALRRFLDRPRVVINRNQRLAPHSAAGGRRRSVHTPMSDMMESEMGSIAEEDEDEDTSMDGFIVNESSESQSQSSASASEQTPQPPPSRAPEASSRASSLSSAEDSGPVPQPGRPRTTRFPSGPDRLAGFHRLFQGRQEFQQPNGGVEVQEEEDDEEDELPIANGRRRSARQVRSTRSQRNMVRDPSEEADDGYRPLGRNRDEADDAGEESDGTTVGWEPTTNSIDRLRNAGSLTPTADRPHPAVPTTPRTGNSGPPLGSRGIRRRSSVLSNTGQHYEDNDADDDGTDVDGEGDVAMSRPPLRQRTSRIRIAGTNSTPSTAVPPPQVSRIHNEFDSDESDNADRPPRRGYHPRLRAPAYNARVSMLFADFQADLANPGEEDDLGLDPLGQLRGSNRTPIARPRTANRNRTPANGVGPSNMNNTGATFAGYTPNRLRTPGAERAQPPRSEERVILSRNTPVGIPSDASSFASGTSPSPFASNRIIGEDIQRPPSRLPSGYSPVRRNSGDIQVITEPLQGTYMAPGLNTARTFQNRPGNPFHTNPRNPFHNPSVRPRQSAQRLRDQPSTATLRSRTSARALRNQMSPANPRMGVLQTGEVRSPARINITNELSNQRVQPRSSARNLRSVTAAGPSSSTPSRNQVTFAMPGGSTSDRRRTIAEPIDRRQREMSETSSVSSSTSNPFRIQRQPPPTVGPSVATRQENVRPISTYRPVNQGAGLPPQTMTVRVEIPENAGAVRRRSGPPRVSGGPV